MEDRYEQERLKKREALIAMGIDPHGGRLDDVRPIGEVVSD